MRHLVRLFVIASLLAAGPLHGRAGAAELKVLSAGAMRAVLQQVAPEFEKSTGHKLSIEFATAGGVEKKVADEETIDVAILTKPRMDKLVSAAKVAGGSTAVLARAPIGLAVKKGAPHPDIGSVEAFKKALLAAKSVAYTDPASGGTSGIHMAQVIDKLGIGAELKPKTRLISATQGQGSPRVGEAVAKGEAEIGIQPISELQEVQGIEVVGPLPAELQSPDLVYVAGTPNTTEQPLPAQKLIEFLKGAAVAPVYKEKGLQPG